MIDSIAPFIPNLIGGLWVSLKLTAATLAMGLPLGLLLALLSASPWRVVRWLVVALVEIGRGTPMLVVLQIFYFGLPAFGVTLTSFLAAALALALTTAAYTSEILRGALLSVNQGTIEAAMAMGMNEADRLRDVILPQALRVALPALIGFSILMFQGTSLAYTIALPELLSQAYSAGSSTFRYLAILSIAGLMYAVITIPMSLITDRLEKRMSRFAA
ncbi:amino acid ABC transporter permease [Mariniluteicoccus endophyticus]